MDAIEKALAEGLADHEKMLILRELILEALYEVDRLPRDNQRDWKDWCERAREAVRPPDPGEEKCHGCGLMVEERIERDDGVLVRVTVPVTVSMETLDHLMQSGFHEVSAGVFERFYPKTRE